VDKITLNRDDLEHFLDAMKLLIGRISLLQPELANRKPVEPESIAALEQHLKEAAIALGEFRVCVWLGAMKGG
jgi:hypothetical protein